MGNCIFLYPNYADASPLYTPDFDDSGDWDSDLPLANLQDRRLHKPARSASVAIADTRLRCDLKADRQVRGVVIPKHSISSAGYVRVLGVPSSLLFDYEAGDDIAALGGTFTRATDATYIDRNWRIRTAASGVPRDGHFINGVRTLLLEEARTQICPNPQTPNSWNSQGTPVITTGIADPWGGTSAILVEDDDGAASEGKFVVVSFTGDGTKAVTVAVRAGTLASLTSFVRDNTAGVSRHTVSITWNGGTTAPTVVTTSGSGTIYPSVAVYDANGTLWWLVSYSANSVVAANQNVVDVIGPSASTGTFYFAGANAWNAAFPTSWQPSAAHSRAVDVLSYPIPSAMTTPAAATWYVKFVERGTILGGASAFRIFQIGESGSNNGAMRVFSTATGYRADLTDGAGAATSSSTLAVAPTIGDSVELRITISSTGVVQIHQSINGAAEVSATAGAAGGLRSQWGTGTAKIFLGCISTAGANAGAMGLQALRAVSGSATLATMQSIVYDSGWLNQYPSGHTAETLDGMNIPHVVVIPTTQAAFRYCSVQIDDTTNPAGYVDLARLVIAAGWQPSYNFAVGATLGLESGSVRVDTDGFTSSFKVKPVRRTKRFTVHDLADSEAFGSAFDLMRLANTHRQLFFITDPDDTTHMHRRAFLATLRQLTAVEYVAGARKNVPFELVEEL